MTAVRLRQLVEAATPGKWVVGAREKEEYYAEFSPVVVDSDDPWAPNVVLAFAEADAKLAALAPELARWAADAADLLDRTLRGDWELDEAHALLARLANIREPDRRALLRDVIAGRMSVEEYVAIVKRETEELLAIAQAKPRP